MNPAVQQKCLHGAAWFSHCTAEQPYEMASEKNPEILWHRDEDYRDGKTVAGAHPPSDGTFKNQRGPTMTSGIEK